MSVNNCSIFIRVKYCVSQLLDKVKGDPGPTFYVALFQYLPHSPFHSHTDGGGCHARCQLHIRSNLGFSFLLKATLTCSSAHSGGTGILISGIRTCNLPITRWAALPAELQLGSLCYPVCQKVKLPCHYAPGTLVLLESFFHIDPLKNDS